MKKILSVMLLAICFVIGINFADESKANAEDIYIGTFKGGSGFTISIYIDPDNFKLGGLGGHSGFSGIIKYDYGDMSAFGMLVYEYYKGVWYVAGDVPADRMRDAHPLSRSSSLAQKIFNIVYPRLKNRDAEKAQKAAAEKARQEREQKLAEEKRRREEAERKRIEAEKEAERKRIEAEKEAERKRIEAEKERNFNNLIAEGDKFYNAKNYDSAKNSYAKARNINTSKVENLCNALINKGDELKNDKNFVAAIDYFRKANVMGSSKAGDGLYESLVEAGSAARANKKFDDAINLLNEAINFQPNNSWAYNNLGITYKDMGEYNKAIEQYNKALQISPNYKYVYNNRGYSYKYLKDYDNAIADYKKALSLDSNYFNADSGLQDTYIESKKFDEAIEYYSQKIAKNKSDSLSYFRLGYFYYELKDYQNSAKNYEQAVKLNPTADTYYNLGLAYQNMGNNKKAVETYSKIFENVTGSDKYENDANFQYKMAVAYDDLKNYPKAIEHYKKVIELTKKYIDNYVFVNGEGKVITGENDGNGNFNTVVENYLLISDYQENYRGRLGRVYFKQKNYSEALKYFDEAIDKFHSYHIGDIMDDNTYQGDNNVYWLRGQCHENLKQYDKALEDYKDALEFDENNKKIQDAIKRVSKLIGKK